MYVCMYVCAMFLIICIVAIKLFGYNWLGNIRFVLIMAILPSVIFLAINLKWLRKILEVKPLIHLGELSLPIYFWHFPVQCVIYIIGTKININYSHIKVWLVYIFIVLVISEISNHFMKVFKLNK